MKPTDAVKIYKNMPSLHQMAVKYTKAILTNDKYLQSFAKDSDMPTYIKAVKTLLKLRSKEFAGDFVKNLELRLKKEASKQ